MYGPWCKAYDHSYGKVSFTFSKIGQSQLKSLDYNRKSTYGKQDLHPHLVGVVSSFNPVATTNERPNFHSKSWVSELRTNFFELFFKEGEDRLIDLLWGLPHRNMATFFNPLEL